MVIPSISKADLIIDSFEDGSFSVTTSSSSGDTQFGLTGVIGGVRTVDVFAAGAGTATAELNLTGGDDSVSLTTSANTLGFFQFSYGSLTPAGDLNLDLETLGPNQQATRLELTYFSDVAGTTTITLNDGVAFSSVTANFVAGTNNLTFDFADFEANSIGGLIDLSDVSGIRVTTGVSNGSNAATVTYASFSTGGLAIIPEPSVLVAGMFCCLGMVTRRRK